MAKVKFRTNILLKSIIGKDLITDDNIAVLELVKNSFDAGSNLAHIIFKNVISNQDIKEYKKSNESKIIIRDTGSGIAAQDIRKIFEPFYTTKPVGTGTGLGLSLSYSIVQKHKGEIKVTSTLGVGTSFTVILPILTPADVSEC